MKIENWQLLLLAIGGFAAIVLIDVLWQNEDFRKKFPLTPKAQFAQSIAPQLEQEEHEIAEPDIPYVEPEEATQEES